MLRPNAGLHGPVLAWLACAFREIGRRVGMRPLRSIFTTVFVCGVMALGMLRGRTETSYEMLWFPQQSTAWDDYQFEQRWFGQGPRTEIWIADAQMRGSHVGDVLQNDALVPLLSLHERLTEQKAHSSAWGNVCKPSWPGGPCTIASVLGVWNWSAPAIITSDTQRDVSSDPLFIATSGSQTIPISRARVVGGETWSDNSTILSAKALQSSYLVASDEDGLAEEYELDFLRICRDTKVDGVEIRCFTDRSMADEQTRSLAADKAIMPIAFILMIVYASFSLGSCHLVRSRVLLGLSVVITVGLALGVAFGMGGIFDWPFSTLSLMSVFIVLGVGVDDMFVVVDAFDRAAARREWRDVAVESTVAQTNDLAVGAFILSDALEEVGSSILLTSLTDLLAFSVGSLIDLPAVSSFCLTAAVAVAAVFVIVTTLFAPLLVLDYQRQRAGRVDVLICYHAARLPGGSSPNENRARSGQRAMEVVFGELVNRLASPWAQLFVIMAFFCLSGAGASMLATGRLGVGTDWSDFFPRDSYLLPFFNVRDTYFGEQATLEIMTGAVDVTRSEHREALVALSSAFEAETWALPPIHSWFRDWETWRLATEEAPLEYSDKVALCLSLSTFLSGSGVRYSADVVVACDNVSEMVHASRLTLDVAFPFRTNTDLAVEWMQDARHAAATSTVGCLKSRVFNYNFLWMERYRTIRETVTQSLMGAFIGALIILALFMPFLAAVATTLIVVNVNLCIFLGMAIIGLRLNIATLVNLVMAVGFSVDFTVHIVMRLLEQAQIDPTTPMATHVRTGLSEMGVSVLNGGISTLVAVAALSLSTSAGYEIVLQMFSMVRRE